MQAVLRLMPVPPLPNGIEGKPQRMGASQEELKPAYTWQTWQIRTGKKLESAYTCLGPVEKGPAII